LNRRWPWNDWNNWNVWNEAIPRDERSIAVDRFELFEQLELPKGQPKIVTPIVNK